MQPRITVDAGLYVRLRSKSRFPRSADKVRANEQPLSLAPCEKPRAPIIREGARRACAVTDPYGRGAVSSLRLSKASARRRPATEQSEGAQLGAPTKRA